MSRSAGPHFASPCLAAAAFAQTGSASKHSALYRAVADIDGSSTSAIT
jgi:hypothetical protein